MMWMNQKKSKAGLENQRDIPRAHIGFYTQCGKGLENQRCRQHMGNQRHAQAFTISAAQLHRAGEPAKDPKSTQRLLHSMWQRAGEPETPWHAQAFTLRVAQGWGTRENSKSPHRLLHSMWCWAREPERHSECAHRLLCSMQHRKDI